MASRPRLRPPRPFCRRAVFLCSDENQSRMQTFVAVRWLRQGRCHSGGFLLRIMPPSWHSVPACVPRLRCRRAVLYRHDDCAASIPKSGLEIKNRCTQESVNRQKLALIPKSGPEIKNQCTNKAVSEENLASIHKFGLEIKNRCTQEGVKQGKTCIDSQVWP